MATSRTATRKLAGIALAVVAGVVVVVLAMALVSPVGPKRALKLAVIATGAAAVSVYDPWEGEARGDCSCSSDFAYRCDYPEHAYYDRVRQDPRTRHLFATGKHDLATWLGYAEFLRNSFPHRPHSRFFSHPREVLMWNVLEQLDEVDKGEGFMCDAISKMLTQLVHAAGGFARVVQLEDHVVAEVWAEDLQRWVMIDADNNVHYTDRTGTPLGAAGIQRIAATGRVQDVVALPGASTNTLYEPAKHARLLRSFRLVSIRARADWVSRPLPYTHPRRHPRANTALLTSESGVPPWAWLRWAETVQDEKTLYFRPCRPAATPTE